MFFCSSNSVHLLAFPVAHHRPCIQCQGKAAQGEELGYHLEECAAFEVHQPHYLYKVFQRIKNGDGFRPFRHTGRGGEQPAHQ